MYLCNIKKNYCQINHCYVITLIHRMASRKDILFGVKCYVSEWKCMFLCEDFIPYSFWFKWPCVVVFFSDEYLFCQFMHYVILNLYFTNFFKEVRFFLKSYSHFHWLNVGNLVVMRYIVLQSGMGNQYRQK